MKRFIKSFMIALALITAVTVVLPNQVVNVEAKTSMKRTIYVGQTLKLYVIGVKKKKVKWKSTNKKVAKVSKKGKVKGLRPGKATIIAKVGKRSLKCKLTVKKRPAGSNLSAGQRNALARAKSYLDLMAFSKQGLKDQLVFDGFSNSDAQFAVDHCGANWYEQAARSAREYAKYAYSRNDLIEQLVYIKFTNDQAVYGVNRL
ncbi:Host cell surface-exposed lipoprotein [Kandleria vitulina]|nr:Ltp family lipoprotein [Kandleria vitulina]SDM21015.1 Host cell surface-exposed lipoprotein [Kandleria vitulina]